MKKFLLALTAVAAMTGTASAADLAAKPYVKAPVAAPVYSWTGCYIGGGFGYGWYGAESRQVDPVTGVQLATEGDTNGKGWLGQGGAGCDYQFAGPMGNWVIGLLGDYTFSDVKGDHIGAPVTTSVGSLKNDYSWAVGARVGYLVSPTFLTYFNAGYTQAHFKDTTYFGALGAAQGVPTGTYLQGATYNGWFLGSGFEYSMNWLPGLFWKTEYRYSQFDRKQLGVNFTATGLPTGLAETVKPVTQSVITSLVYRFNWGGPVVAKY